MLPAMGNPHRTGTRGVRPIAFDPDISVAIPILIAIDPNPSGMRWTMMHLHDGRRWPNADYDLSQCGRRCHTKSKQQ